MSRRILAEKREVLRIPKYFGNIIIRKFNETPVM